MAPITLQQLLDALADDGADLAELLSGEAGQATDIAELEAEALRVFDEIRTRDVVSEEDVAAQEQLADVVEALRAEQGRRDAAAAAEQQARIAELAGRVNPAADDAGDETGEDGGEQEDNEDGETDSGEEGDGAASLGRGLRPGRGGEHRTGVRVRCTARLGAAGASLRRLGTA